MSRTRRFDIAAIALTVAVLAGLGFALRPQETPTITVAPSTAHVDRPQPPAATRPSALFIGDSYTGGSRPADTGASGLAEMSYGCMAAVRMGWLCDLAAMPGTGYISGGPANRSTYEYLGVTTSFSERIPHLAAKYDPDIVFLDGGRNDLFPPREDVFKAMRGTIEDARRTWPNAKIVFVRPRFLAKPGDDLGFDDNFMARLESDPATSGVLFVDPIASFIGTDTSALLSTDGIHPNPQGERDLASALVGSLAAYNLAVA
jgi:lysophospholipase L1-like esterase